MNNEFIERIKHAEREVLALKTAHPRGLGNLKVYEQAQTVSGHTSGIWYLTVTVDFDNNFAAYPLVYLIPTMKMVSGSSTYSMNYYAFDFSNNGYRAKFKLLWSYKVDTNSFVVESTSPIDSISLDWEEF